MSVQLRELSIKDLPVINTWRNDHAVIDMLGNNFTYISTEVDEKWYENYLRNREQNRRLAIIEGNSEELIGTIQLTNIHQLNRSAEYSIMIGNKNYWGKGIGLSVTKKILEHGFRDLNLNRIYLTVLSNNLRAVKLYEKAGFKKEGIQKEAIYKNGSFHDLIGMAILKRNFA